MSLRFVRLLLIATLVLTGCSRSSTPDGGRTVTDDLGRTVPLPDSVNRVVSLAPNLTEIVYAAGAGSSLVGVTKSADHPPPVDSVPHVSALPVDFEAIAAQNPDLVLATDQINAPNDAKTFEALNLPVYFFSFDTLDDVVEGVRTTGRLLGTKGAAARRAAVLQRSLDTLQARTALIPSEEQPRVLVLVGDETLYSFGAGSYVQSLVDLAGGRSITADIENQAPTLSAEYVLTQKPDVIVGLWGNDYDPDRLLRLHPSWDIVPALQHDRVYSLPAALIARPGPRIVDGAYRLANLFHPNRVSLPAPSRPSPTSPSASPAP